MKIVDVEVWPLHLPMAASTPVPVGGETSASHTLVRVRTDQGIDGCGEVFRLAGAGAAALITHELKPLVMGQDPRRIEFLWDRMYRSSFRYGRAGIVLHAISGIEIALWDILGKSCGLPVYQLLGGATRERMPAYASMHKYAEPEHAAEVALRCVAQGYGAIKLHQRDAASVRAVRDAVGPDITLMLDASGAWTPREALRMAEALADYDLAWLEEPLAAMDDYEGLRWLRDRSPVPIAAGENEYTHMGFREMIARRAVDVVQPDVIKAGGIAATRRIIALAESFDLDVSPHCFYYGPGIAATLHVCLATPRARYVEINPLELVHDIMTPALRPVGGQLAPPTGPGLGISLSDSLLREFRRSFTP
jgi:L-alanine-DL-glutamate epimerase-like enolase superfamily enzyme